MNKSAPIILLQIYTLLVLLVAGLASRLPYSAVALGLLLVMFFSLFRPLAPRPSIVLALVTIALLPLLLAPSLAYYLSDAVPLPSIILPVINAELVPTQLAAVIATLPVICLLGYSLGQNAREITPLNNAMGRHFTSVPVTLFLCLLALLLVSLVTNSPLLFLISLIVVLYFLLILLRVVWPLPPRSPLNITSRHQRIIAGNTASFSLSAQNRAAVKLHYLIRPVDSWLKITPPRFSLGQAKKELNVTVTPPLSGPSRPQLKVSATDPWGFVQLNQLAEPLELEVIPRARYARWLAMRYLEETRAGTATDTGRPPEAIIMPRRGLEYSSSRSYQPGDRLKDIDWKHTLKLNQLTVKEFVETGGQAAIIAADLSVPDAEEADKLAFNLITTALTLAGNTIPAALAIFNHEKVISATAAANPDRILKQTLLLVKDITQVAFPERSLQSADLGRLRRNIAWLEKSSLPPAQRLRSLLEFELQAIRAAARNHPATTALSRVTKQVLPPAVIVLVSPLNHDAEALLLTLENLTKRRYNVLCLGEKPGLTKPQ